MPFCGLYIQVVFRRGLTVLLFIISDTLALSPSQEKFTEVLTETLCGIPRCLTEPAEPHSEDEEESPSESRESLRSVEPATSGMPSRFVTLYIESYK